MTTAPTMIPIMSVRYPLILERNVDAWVNISPEKLTGSVIEDVGIDRGEPAFSDSFYFREPLDFGISPMSWCAT